MIQNRRLFVTKALTSAGGLFVASCLPKTMYGGCKEATSIYRINQPIPGPRKLGDCEMRSLVIHLGPTGESFFKAQVATHHTHTKDVWHLRLQIVSWLKAKHEKHVWFDKTFDGPRMSELDVSLFHDWTETFTVPLQALQPPSYAFPSFLQLVDCC